MIYDLVDALQINKSWSNTPKGSELEHDSQAPVIAGAGAARSTWRHFCAACRGVGAVILLAGARSSLTHSSRPQEQPQLLPREGQAADEVPSQQEWLRR
jgi:hypothetical protein